eukprot:4001670-Prymnesium_polylepis.1
MFPPHHPTSTAIPPIIFWRIFVTTVDYHVPASPAHRPSQHPADDAQALEPASRHKRGRAGARATWAAQGDYLLDLSTTPE